jgi:hypothetical protein
MIYWIDIDAVEMDGKALFVSIDMFPSTVGIALFLSFYNFL